MSRIDSLPENFSQNTQLPIRIVSPGHQVQQLSNTVHGNDYYKLGFDEECLSRLPRLYPFLLTPLGKQKISFSPTAATRLKAIFEILVHLLSTSDTDPELILAYLPTSIYELVQLVGETMESSSEPLQDPWYFHADGSLARSLGFRPVIRTVYQAVQEHLL